MTDLETVEESMNNRDTDLEAAKAQLSLKLRYRDGNGDTWDAKPDVNNVLAALTLANARIAELEAQLAEKRKLAEPVWPR